jgi:hypothetical protein
MSKISFVTRSYIIESSEAVILTTWQLSILWSLTLGTLDLIKFVGLRLEHTHTHILHVLHIVLILLWLKLMLILYVHTHGQKCTTSFIKNMLCSWLVFLVDVARGLYYSWESLV